MFQSLVALKKTNTNIFKWKVYEIKSLSLLVIIWYMVSLLNLVFGIAATPILPVDEEGTMDRGFIAGLDIGLERHIKIFSSSVTSLSSAWNDPLRFILRILLLDADGFMLIEVEGTRSNPWFGTVTTFSADIELLFLFWKIL